MHKITKMAGLVWLVLATATLAQAQEEAAEEAAPAEAEAPAPEAEPAPEPEPGPAPVAEEASAEDAEAAADTGEDADAEADEDPMGSLLLGLKLSIITFGDTAEVKAPSTPGGAPEVSGIGSRTNFGLTLPLNFGGGGFGFDLQPSIAFGDATTLGLYLGPAYHLGFGKLYVNLGLGLQAGFIMEDAIDLGADLYARIPIGATYYVMPDIGLFGELGLGFGATGIKPKVPAGLGLDPELKFGTTTLIDFGVGVRWP